MKRVWLFVFGVLLVSACSVTPPKQATSTGPAVLLLAEAQKISAAGDHAKAIALIERAVRLEPRNGNAWLELAKLHFSDGDLGKAEQFARRALQFAGTDQALVQQSRALLEQIRLQQLPG